MQVLLWEIGTFAKTPWGVFGVQEMVQAIERGDRLANEPTIPDFLYEKMRRRRPEYCPSAALVLP